MSVTETKPNILIVDDDESLRHLLVISAKSRGWHPVAAETGREGLQLLNSAIMAVVLDHGLPDGDGIEVLAQLREKQISTDSDLRRAQMELRQYEKAKIQSNHADRVERCGNRRACA